MPSIATMPIGTARSKLQRKIIWDLLVRQGENQCARCDDWINSSEDLAITHIEPWLDNDPELFWDHNNVAFMHPTCAEEYASEREAARRQKEQEMEIVRVGIVNDRGEWLPGCFHNGKVYVVGKHGERYNIHLRNLTGSRIEVVLTVDGRDVITGEEGSKQNRGYILHAFETCTIEGWRTDMGRIYIQYGEPDDIESQPVGRMLNAWETWYYYNHHTKFIFVDREGFGEFVLVEASRI